MEPIQFSVNAGVEVMVVDCFDIQILCSAYQKE